MEIIEVTPSNKKYSYLLAARTLKNGGVIIFPTDTIYGILADATNPKAVRKVFKIKNRKAGKAFPILVPSLATTRRYGLFTTSQVRKAKHLWPGPHTLIVTYRGNLARGVINRNDNSVALRVPRSRIIKKLLEQTKKPLVATSANISGDPYHENLTRLFLRLKRREHKPNYLFNFGSLPRKRPSDILDIRGERETKIR